MYLWTPYLQQRWQGYTMEKKITSLTSGAGKTGQPPIQVFQEAGQVVWYFHFFQNYPQCIVLHTVKGFGIVNKAEIDVFLELSCFFDDPAEFANLISGSSAFSKTSLNIWNSQFTYY